MASVGRQYTGLLLDALGCPWGGSGLFSGSRRLNVPAFVEQAIDDSYEQVFEHVPRNGNVQHWTSHTMMMMMMMNKGDQRKRSLLPKSKTHELGLLVDEAALVGRYTTDNSLERCLSNLRIMLYFCHIVRVLSNGPV